MARLLPLFPLQLVVFPDSPVPLHIFEPRYREMVGEAEAEGSEFGIVRTISQGENSGIANIGCTVTVESVVRRYPDGRFDVIARGRRRFHIVSLDEEKAYLRAEVDFFDDETAEQSSGEFLDRALAAHEQLQRVAGVSPPEEPGSFRLAEAIEDLDFRSTLLQSRSERERLRLFAEFVPGYIERLEYVSHMKRKSPTNGSGHKHSGISE